MLNNRDDNDSEYHFTDSDEEANYELDTESSKPEIPAKPQKELGVDRSGQSRRILISVGVFLLLVFVVYKMVSPTTSVPSTNITPAVATPPAPQKVMQQKPVQQAAIAPNPTAVPAQAVATQAVATLPTADTNAIQPTQPSTAQQPATNQPVMATAMPEQTNGMQQAPINPPAPAAQTSQQGVTMPAIMPVASTPSNYNVNPPLTQSSTSMDAKAANMSLENEKMMSQLQADYMQKMNDFAAQSKAMQDQLQGLNSRVATMENQLNQLVQTLTRQQQENENAANSNNASAAPARYLGSDRSLYTVQAIIPGRAWLRSDNGETLTVAEGDLIKGLGKVTKIDPYDGVVQINTGSKVISLSYGNGG